MWRGRRRPNVIQRFPAQTLQLRLFISIKHRASVPAEAAWRASRTQRPNTCSPARISAATCTTGRPVSITGRAACSRNSGVYFRRLPDIRTNLPAGLFPPVRRQRLAGSLEHNCSSPVDARHRTVYTLMNALRGADLRASCRDGNRGCVSRRTCDRVGRSFR